MNIGDYTEKEIEYVVNSFKAYIKLVANHAAIDYARKIKSQKYKVISLNELRESEVSLSREDSDTFVLPETTIDEIFTNYNYAKAFKKLSEVEKKVLYLYSKNSSINEISKRLKLTKSNVTTVKNRAITKFKRNISEVDNNEKYWWKYRFI